MQHRKQLEEKLIEKAMKDEDFRKQLIDNPAVAIQSFFGVKIPDTFKITVLEEDANSYFLVLPFKNEEAGDELSEEQLEQVAGGYTGDITCFADSWATCNPYLCN